MPRFSRVALALVALKLGLHIAALLVTPYEFHRDEFLYFAMGTHLRPARADGPVRSLSPEEQSAAVLYGANYGQAGAIDLYGRHLGLPPVVSLAGSFYLFGPGTRPGQVVILLGGSGRTSRTSPALRSRSLRGSGTAGPFLRRPASRSWSVGNHR